MAYGAKKKLIFGTQEVVDLFLGGFVTVERDYLGNHDGLCGAFPILDLVCCLPVFVVFDWYMMTRYDE